MARPLVLRPTECRAIHRFIVRCLRVVMLRHVTHVTARSVGTLQYFELVLREALGTVVDAGRATLARGTRGAEGKGHVTLRSLAAMDKRHRDAARAAGTCAALATLTAASSLACSART